MWRPARSFLPGFLHAADPMTDPGVPRIRKSPLPDDAVLVVRGDALDTNLLRRDALRFHRRYFAWGRYGISAFYATSDAEVDALCETRLVQFPTLVVFQRAEWRQTASTSSRRSEHPTSR